MRTHTAYTKVCEVCGTEFTTVPTSSKQFCCSLECSRIRRIRNRKVLPCLWCGGNMYELKRKSGSRKYCCTACKIAALAEARRKAFEGKGIWGEWANYKDAKRYYVATYGACQRCGYDTEPAILELHHKDRNRKHNVRENLVLLCPNCHTLEHYYAKDGQFHSNLGVTYHAIDGQREKAD